MIIGINGKIYRAHRLAWLYMTGKWPKEEIDHKDTNSLNDKIENLRICNDFQNKANRKTPSTNKTGFKG